MSRDGKWTRRSRNGNGIWFSLRTIGLKCARNAILRIPVAFPSDNAREVQFCAFQLHFHPEMRAKCANPCAGSHFRRSNSPYAFPRTRFESLCQRLKSLFYRIVRKDRAEFSWSWPIITRFLLLRWQQTAMTPRLLSTLRAVCVTRHLRRAASRPRPKGSRSDHRQ